ncbi:MAG: prephenate dehydratase [Acidobacteriaceae bacterium]|nr:prephenate dehydratase [Acidobacteriaceae bacterium]
MVETLKIAIQGELGSNSHMAAVEMLQKLGGEVPLKIVACALSDEVFAKVASGAVDAAVLPIENSLYGSVAEHYDLMLEEPVQIVGEALLRIRHNMIAAPGVKLEDVRKVLSHPVALAQCRRFLAAHREFEVTPFYDTAGSVKHVVSNGLRDVAGIAPMLAATEYGGEVLVAGIEDHAQNFTRFNLMVRDNDTERWRQDSQPNKMSIAFAVEHRPGTLVGALVQLAAAGVNLTRIESRPVPGSPWEYVFFVDARFDLPERASEVVETLRQSCRMVKVLGVYRAA